VEVVLYQQQQGRFYKFSK